MLATPINNTLYGCKNWSLAQANAHRIQPDVPEQDVPEENSWNSLTLGAGRMEHYEAGWKHVTLHLTSLYEVIMREYSSISGDHMAWNWYSIENLQSSLSDSRVVRGHTESSVDQEEQWILACGISARRTHVYTR